jgi:hypothetical protein
MRHSQPSPQTVDAARLTHGDEFIQRIINGGGRIEREYGWGRKRTDPLLIWNYQAGVQRVVLDLKVGTGVAEALIHEWLEQTVGYMD